jgi:hypothetical protein
MPNQSDSDDPSRDRFIPLEPTPAPGSFGVGICVFALFAVLIAVRIPRISNPLLDGHNFRQTQTAITAYWFVHGHFNLFDYETPVLGFPWRVPFEFPLYQAVVALVNMAGVPLDLSCRLTSVAVFVALVATTAALLWRVGSGGLIVTGFLVLAAFSPFAVVWSRACLIDFLSALLGTAYLYLAFRFSGRPLTSWKVSIIALTGTLASMAKPTTFPVFWVPMLALGAEALFLAKTPRPGKGYFRPASAAQIGQWLLILLVPLALAILWTNHTDRVRGLSPMEAGLNGPDWHVWNYGDLPQREHLENWAIIGNRVATLVAFSASFGRTRCS